MFRRGTIFVYSLKCHEFDFQLKIALVVENNYVNIFEFEHFCRKFKYFLTALITRNSSE